VEYLPVTLLTITGNAEDISHVISLNIQRAPSVQLRAENRFVRKICHREISMKYKSLTEKQRQTILTGISQNLGYKENAYHIGVRRMELVRIVKAMRRIRDPDLLNAQLSGEAKIDERKRAKSKRRDEKFYEMTGMTLQEKTHQNMVNFYKPELINILNCEDELSAIRELPASVRKTLKKNNILTKRRKPEISKSVREQLY